ncbi:MAG TPA: hypothetical protein VJ739_01425 [Gemmataceae bacterium]|nr:hypothetical protein [Gemmataceae bacterium]
MSKLFLGSGALSSLLAVSLLVLGGCSKDDPKAGQTKGTSTPVAAKKVDDHSGWWCEEHGIPEAECSMCSAKVAKECKARGDWCEKHDRAKSQCFICDPSLKEKYAAKYRAKYGKEPPPIQDEVGEEKKAEKK